MSDYPNLSEQGIKEAEEIINAVKSKVVKEIEYAIGDLYVYLPDYIESDSYFNFRNHIIRDIKEYRGSDKNLGNDLKNIREAILKHHREDIINDLNQDSLDEIESLKKWNLELQDRRW